MIIRTIQFQPLDGSFRTERIITLSVEEQNSQKSSNKDQTEGQKGTSSIIIGRGKNLSDCLPNTLIFQSRVVSRNHGLVLLRPDGKFYLQDTGSSSGTFINKSRLSAPGVKSSLFELLDGDKIQLGENMTLDGVAYTSISMIVHLDIAGKLDLENTSMTINLTSVTSPGTIENILSSPLEQNKPEERMPQVMDEKLQIALNDDVKIEQEVLQLWSSISQSSISHFTRLKTLLEDKSLQSTLQNIASSSSTLPSKLVRPIEGSSVKARKEFFAALQNNQIEPSVSKIK